MKRKKTQSISIITQRKPSTAQPNPEKTPYTRWKRKTRYHPDENPVQPSQTQSNPVEPQENPVKPKELR